MKKRVFLFLGIFVLCLTLGLGIGLAVNNQHVKKADDLVVGNIQDNDTIKLSMKKLAATSTQANNQVKVTATVNPSSVVNNKLDWTLTWKTSNSANVSDYVTMQVSEDTLSVTLTYKKQFSTQIVLKATSRLVSTVSATCTVDCYKRIQTVTLTGNAKYDSKTEALSINNSTKVIDFSKYNYSNLLSLKLDGLTVSHTELGTLSTTITVSNVKVVLSDELISAISSAGVSMDNSFESLYSTYNSIYMAIINMPDKESHIEKLQNILNTLDHWVDVTFTISNMYNSTSIESLSYTYKCTGFNIGSGMPNSVTFDQTGIAF